jgi:hypothetical protein
MIMLVSKSEFETICNKCNPLNCENRLNLCIVVFEIPRAEMSGY